MDLELGKEALRTGSNYVSNRIGNVNFNFLKPYFDVDDAYLINKIVLILFPYLKSQWDMDDNRINKPDLYIPMMSLFTFIIVKSMYLGLKSLFTPEHIGLIFTRLMFFEIVLLFIFKIITFVLNIKLKILDIICFSGYKYFIVLIFQILPRSKIINLPIKIYGYVSFFFFSSRSLKNCFVYEFSSDKTKKLYFLFGFVLIQTLFIFFLY